MISIFLRTSYVVKRLCTVHIEKSRKGNCMRYIEGRLGYNSKNGRYGLLVSDLWVKEGFHCGDFFEIKIADRWVHTHIELDTERKWYLVDTALRDTDLEFVKARICTE